MPRRPTTSSLRGSSRLSKTRRQRPPRDIGLFFVHGTLDSPARAVLLFSHRVRTLMKAVPSQIVAFRAVLALSVKHERSLFREGSQLRFQQRVKRQLAHRPLNAAQELDLFGFQTPTRDFPDTQH